jgi:hypothetical protein
MTAATEDRKSAVPVRWAGVFLRCCHVLAVVGLGAGLLGAPVAVGRIAVAAMASGVAMFALDIWQKPSRLRELAGVAVLLKLVLVVWLAVDAPGRLALFWLIVAGSVVFAHAPARFRHRLVLRAKPRRS